MALHKWTSFTFTNIYYKTSLGKLLPEIKFSWNTKQVEHKNRQMNINESSIPLLGKKWKQEQNITIIKLAQLDFK